MLTIRGRLITPFILGSMSVGLNILIHHSFTDLWVCIIAWIIIWIWIMTTTTWNCLDVFKVCGMKGCKERVYECRNKMNYMSLVHNHWHTQYAAPKGKFKLNTNTLKATVKTNELLSQEKYLWTWAPSEFSDQPAPLHCLIRILTGWILAKLFYSNWDNDQTVRVSRMICVFFWAHMPEGTFS